MHILFSLVLVICFSLVVPQEIVFEKIPIKFRRDYTFEKDVHKYYKADAVPRTWTQASSICKMESATLALPSTAQEVIALKRHSGAKERTWVGLNDIRSEGDFFTGNGTCTEEFAFSNWADNEPNNEGDNEDCVVADINGFWNDVRCDNKYPFVCEKDANHHPNYKYYANCETSDRDYFYHNTAERCYKVHTSPRTWHDAYRVCSHELSSLAMIESAIEADIFKSNMHKYPEHTLRENFNKSIVLLGFSDLTSPGEFLNINGGSIENSEYTEWADVEASQSKHEHCGAMLRNGQLIAVPCDVRAMFICEKILVASDPLITGRSGIKMKIINA